MRREGTRSRPYVLDYLHDCNERDAGITFGDIRVAGNVVLASVCVHSKTRAFDYMDEDPWVRMLCKEIAEDLRDAAGRSVYFTLTNGELRIITA